MTVKQLGYQLNLAIIIADDHAISHFVDYNSPQNGNCVNLTQSDGKCKKKPSTLFPSPVVRPLCPALCRSTAQHTSHIPYVLYELYRYNYTMHGNKQKINKQKIKR